MPIQIAFEVHDDDLERFAVMARRLKSEMPDDMDAGTLAGLVRAKLNAARMSGDTPKFVLDRIDRLEQLADMAEDTEWGLEGEDRDRVCGALFYFAEPNDLIPDRVPVFGFLDDALMVELSLRDFELELTAYREFCGFRTAEKQRREARGSSDEVTKEDWLADQRALLHHHMRERRRMTQDSNQGWKVSLW
jgi:uncharacterized membrane protein YkvA (DUF1232 family)